ncbi:anaerobic ribonucleoside-triphosphate reductase activating protein [Corynebacterium comes]|uniref:Pyrroloquinoline quinone biosynthesis protein PqqE n=1 Tax=Corynebacterium comes TaxID=2675218 RepID=A0A6B8W9U8_9CORY|nr:anaerobic ribonucleoside-triphosphate reductase activating protein [Corynebacterium comes]QGU03718.1 pyrroloquinoline quinone biosynthesis protein PqqE [Corynebacterium comes]
MSASTTAKPTCDLPIAGIIPFSATDWPGRLTVTAFTQGCPLRCVYCHNPSLQEFRPGAHDFAEVLELLDARRGLLDGLVISGGEPTASHGLAEAIAATHDMGFRVGLHTCGYAPNRLAKLFERPDTTPDWIGLDVKGLPQDMPAVAGCTLPVAQASWRSLDLMAASGIELQVRTTLWRGSVLEEHLPELKEKVGGYGQELVVQWARDCDADGHYQGQSAAA